MTPYIFDDRCSYEDAAKAIRQWYDTSADRRIECGLEGSEFANFRRKWNECKTYGTEIR
jgi:hypothetical protein